MPEGAHDTQGKTAPILGAGGVVMNSEGQILLLKHASGTWVFPKGHIDPGETELEAALREVEEEGGVRATCADPDFRLLTRYTNSLGEAREIHWFLLRTDAPSPLLREDLFPDGAFFAPTDALEQLSFPEDRALLQRMLEHAAPLNAQ